MWAGEGGCQHSVGVISVPTKREEYKIFLKYNYIIFVHLFRTFERFLQQDHTHPRITPTKVRPRMAAKAPRADAM